jgi:hypothetical protein
MQEEVHFDAGSVTYDDGVGGGTYEALATVSAAATANIHDRHQYLLLPD